MWKLSRILLASLQYDIQYISSKLHEMTNEEIKCHLHNIMLFISVVRISSPDLIKSDIIFYML